MSTPMTAVEKAWIDHSDYGVLYRKWSNSTSRDSMFKGDTGKYYLEVMSVKASKLGHDVAVAIRKNVVDWPVGF